MNANQLLYLLQWVPVNDRPGLARSLLADQHPDLVQAFDSLPPDRLARTVLFLTLTPHSREARLAEAARRAGWFPILICCGEIKSGTANHFIYHKVVQDSATLVLVSWLFGGPLVHAFVLAGNQADVFVRFKQHRLILDIYDTAAGFKNWPSELHQLERHCIATADGITHRDLRIQYLHRLHGYKLPRHNLFMPDPIVSAPSETTPQPHERGSEIHVVSIGFVGAGDGSVIRVAQALCAHRIHVHVYFNRYQLPGDPETSAYYQLQKYSPYFHIEDPVYGEAYWQMLRRYDFGLSVNEPLTFGEPHLKYTRDYLEGCGSSRIADYISAGLGVLHTPGLRFQHFWSRRYAAAVVPASPEFLQNPRPHLEAVLAGKTQQPRKNLARVTVEGVALRLGQFYEKVANG